MASPYLTLGAHENFPIRVKVAVKHLRPKGIDLDHTKGPELRERMRKVRLWQSCVPKPGAKLLKLT